MTINQLPQNIINTLEDLESRVEKLEDAPAPTPQVDIQALALTGNGVTTAPEGVAYNPVTVNVPNGYGNVWTSISATLENPFATNDDPTGVTEFRKLTTVTFNTESNCVLSFNGTPLGAPGMIVVCGTSSSALVWFDAVASASSAHLEYQISDGEVVCSAADMYSYDTTEGTSSYTDFSAFLSSIPSSLTILQHHMSNVPYPS